MNINYHKRKDNFLDTLVKILDIQDPQNYIPIYTRFFNLTDVNFNNINLNHKLHIKKINHKEKENANIFNCDLIDIDNNKTITKSIFIKYAPLLDPFKYLIGKYQNYNDKIFKLPKFNNNTEDINNKVTNVNNSSYVDSFFTFLNSKLIRCHNFIHGVDFYGSFLCNKNKFIIDISDDLDFLENSSYFKENKDILYTIKDYSEYFLDIDVKDKPLPPIIIDNNSLPTLSLEDIVDIDNDIFKKVFENVFEKVFEVN